MNTKTPPSISLDQSPSKHTEVISDARGISSEVLSDVIFDHLVERFRSSSIKIKQYLFAQLSSQTNIDLFTSPSIYSIGDLPLGPDRLDEGLIVLRCQQIEASGLLDHDYYASQVDGIAPRDHIRDFVTRGWIQALDPNPLFSVRYYLRQHSDVRTSGIDPLTHYIERGSEEMRNPHPLFLSYYFASNFQSQMSEKGNWLSRFLADDRSTTSPHPIFDVGEYVRRAQIEATCARDALLHYIRSGWKNGIDASPLFRSRFYRDQIGIDDMGMEPYTHYLLFGVPRSVDPHPLFDAARYRDLAKDVDPQLDPLIHYLWKGEQSGLSPSRLFDIAFYRKVCGSSISHRSAFWHYLTTTQKGERSPLPSFNLEEYKKRYIEQPISGTPITALEHLATTGVITLTRSNIDDLSPSVPPPVSQVAIQPSSGTTELPPPVFREYPGKVKHVDGRPNVLLVAHIAAEHLFGSERSFLDMLDALAHLAVNIFVALPRNVPDYTNAIRKQCEHVFVFKYGWWRKNEEMSDSVRDHFCKIIADRRIDVVHANTIMLRECLEAARTMEVPGIVHVRELITHDVDLVNIIGSTVDNIIETVKSRADWIIGNSKATASAFAKEGMTRLIPNTTDIVASEIDDPVRSDKIRFGLISSNLPKKGIFDLVEIAALCAVSAPKAEFLMIGPETSSVVTLRGTIGQQPASNLRFPGYAETPTEAIAQCHVVLNLSHFAESFGRTVLEAMVAGRPVIAYDWGALDELVTPGETGFLAPYKDVKNVAACVKMLCDDPVSITRLGNAAKRAAAKRYGRDSYRRAFRNAYVDVLPLSFLDMQSSSSKPFVRPARRPGLKERATASRIAYFCWHFPVPSETFVLNELRVLVKEGVDVIVFCRQTPYPDFKPDFPVTFERVESPEVLSRRLLETSRTMVHAHFTYPTVTNMVWPACEQAGLPFTFTAHAQDIFVHKNDQLNRLAEIGASRLCLKMFTLSRFHQDFVVGRGFPIDKVIINPNAIDTSRFAVADHAPRPKRDGRRVLAIHRFVPKKGLASLIKAGPLVADLGVTIDIYGYGDLEAEYRKIIEDERIGNVTVHGRLSQEQVVDILPGADLFACPSIRTAEGDMDGIPTSLIESMAAGVPVLTTSIAGISDLVEDELTGILCDPTPEGIAAAIRRFFALPSLHVRAIVEEGRKRAIARHDANRTVKTMRRVWDNDTVDIVIVSWNNLRELRMVVEAIETNTALPYHLIICDNMSRKEEVPRYLDALWAGNDRVTVIHNNRNAMVGPGTNLAMAQGQGEFIIYVCGREGVSFGNGWENAFVRAFDRDDIGLVGTIGYSPSYFTGEQYPTGVRLFDRFRNRHFAIANPTRPFGHVQGGLFAMRRRMVEEIGGFSEDVPHDYTDVEYSYYAESQGWGLANADHVLALFNKSRPTLSQRFREDIKVAHPVLPDQIESFKGVVAGTLRHCNICDWYGEDFDVPGETCPSCGCDPFDRSLFRWLSDSTLLYRRLPALEIGLSGRLLQVWTDQFQGPRLSLVDWNEKIATEGRLSNANARLHLIVLRIDPLAEINHSRSLREICRLLAPSGSIVIYIQPNTLEIYELARRKWLSHIGDTKLSPISDVTYSSKAIRYTMAPLILIHN